MNPNATGAALEGWPVWARGLAAVLPWPPVFARRLAAIYRHYQWLALFYGLVVTQTAHVFGHVAQLIQIHALGLTGADARGIFGALDVEWVHVLWNSGCCSPCWRHDRAAEHVGASRSRRPTPRWAGRSGGNHPPSTGRCLSTSTARPPVVG